MTDPVLFVPALVHYLQNHSGTVSISATMHMNRLEKEDHIFKAFEYFDKDHSG